MLVWVKGGNIISPLLVRNAILSARLKGWQSEQRERENWFGIGEIVLRDNDTVDSLLLRSYQQQDYKSVLDLYELTLKQVELDRGIKKWHDDLPNILSRCQDNGDKFIVGYLEDKLITMGCLKLISVREAEIQQLGVHPDFQRCGYGQKILEYLEIQAVCSGYKVLTVRANSIQIAAQRLYINNGYVEIKRQPYRGMDRVYFKKQLC